MADCDGQRRQILERADCFLSPSVLRADSEIVNRSRFLVSVVFCAIAISLAFICFHLISEDFKRAIFVGVSIGPLLFTLTILRRPERLEMATHYCLSVILTLIVVSPMLSPDAPHLFLGAIVLPLIAVTAGGVRAGLFWTPIVALVLGAGALAFDVSLSERSVRWNSVVVAVAVGIGISLFEDSRQRAKQRALRQRERAEHHATQRLEAERALASSQAILAKAFQLSPSLLILSELATGKIIEVNESFVRISGWQSSEAVGKTLTELDAWVAPEDRKSLIALIVEKGATSSVELRLRTKSGSTIWLLASAAILDLDGSAHVLAQGIDITDRKRSEEELEHYRHLLEERVEERSEQLRESRVQLQEQQQLAAVGTLAAGLAHQINNPIGGILAAAEFALLSDDAADREALRTRALETTVEESRRCGRIVRNMLKFSRHEPTAKWREDLNDIVRRAAEVTRPYVTELGGSLEVDINPGEFLAKVSPIDIEQVLVNVIRNAAESRAGGARVVVSTRRHGDEMSIEIADDGKGVSAADRDRVFDPFFTTRLEVGGSGLGLSVAQGVVTDHRGTLELDSQAEKGTRVTVRLPLHSAES